MDVLSASSFDDKIAWYENDGSGNFSIQQVITNSADRAQSVYAADLDGDGDQDVLSASWDDYKIAWYENNGLGGFGPQQVITISADEAEFVYAADLDGDGDMDVLSNSGGMIVWYENDGSGGFSNQKLIKTEADGVDSIYLTDLDGDDDQDVLFVTFFNTKIAWYENNGLGSFDCLHDIATYSGGVCCCVSAFDLNGDSAMDVLFSSDDIIVWFKNEGSGNFGPQQVITTFEDEDSFVSASDLDGDGDQDVLSAFWDMISWHENDGNGLYFNQNVITTEVRNVRTLYTVDLDKDGDQDVLSASFWDDKIAWYENLTSVIYQDDFNDNIISDTTWQVIETTGTSIAEQNQRLEMQATVIGDAKVKSKFMLQGDFDLRIDFKVSPNEVNGNGLGITVFDEDSSYSINRLYDAGWPTRDGKNGHMYMSNFSGDYSYEGRLSTPADDTTGTLRLTRTGSTVTSYFERENQWIELKSKTGTTEDLYLSIYVMVYGTLMPLQGWADNFTITKGTLEWPEVDAIPESPSQKVTEFRLFQNHPNPFNATTQISYSIPACSRVSLTIYNLRGEEVATLFEGYQNPGTHTVKWDACYSNGHPVSSGVYFYRLKTDNYVTTRKLLLMK